MLAIMVLGWKSGILVGATSGIVAGFVMSFVQGSDLSLILNFGVSGIFAGLLSKFGKFGVIAGFALSIILAVGVYLFIKSISPVEGLEPINFYEMLKISSGELFTVICTAFVCNNLFVYSMFKDKE